MACMTNNVLFVMMFHLYLYEKASWRRERDRQLQLNNIMGRERKRGRHERTTSWRREREGETAMKEQHHGGERPPVAAQQHYGRERPPVAAHWKGERRPPVAVNLKRGEGRDQQSQPFKRGLLDFMRLRPTLMFDDMKSTREREMPMSRTWMRELYYIRIVLELC